MRQNPDTTSDRISLHARGTDEQLSIFVPGDPNEWRQLWSVFWSYAEKPYPIGYFRITAPPGTPPPFDQVTFDITKSGFGFVTLGTDGPIFPRGYDLTFTLGGYGGRKELAVVVR